MPNQTTKPKPAVQFAETEFGEIFHGDSLQLMSTLAQASVDLVMTSPPFGLVRKKSYGNADAHEYLEWFRPFAEQFKRIIKPNGSLVIDIGGAWIEGQATRSLYHYELLIMLCKEYGFHLAQEFFWWNPSRLPTPAEWVTVRRVRVKDAINCIWWLSPTPWPKASNKRVLQAYSESMQDLLVNGYTPKMRPSGHDISDKFGTDNGGAIPPNLIALANTESNSAYIRYCTEKGIKPHPARFPVGIPEFFVRMCTNRGDLVLDPFGGSCVTGEACEKTEREWIACEIQEDYLKGAMGRFQQAANVGTTKAVEYRALPPGSLWNGVAHEEPLSEDGGKTRAKKRAKAK